MSRTGACCDAHRINGMGFGTVFCPKTGCTSYKGTKEIIKKICNGVVHGMWTTPVFIYNDKKLTPDAAPQYNKKVCISNG